MRNWICLAALLAVTGCATVPPQIQGTYADISPARVDPAAFGSEVRWGGVLIDARNEPDHTCFEVLSRDLDKYLRPKVEDLTAGRFIACKPGFYDPEVFARGREVTMTGRVRGIEERDIDDFKYRYPVIDVAGLVLWEVRDDVLVIDYPYDPFWYPYYWQTPYWGYYPYYRYPYGAGPFGPPGRAYGRVRQTYPEPAEIDR